MDFSLADLNNTLDFDQLHVQSWMELGNVDQVVKTTPPEEGSDLSIHSSPIQGTESGHLGRFHDEPPTGASHVSQDSCFGSAASHSNHLSTRHGPPVSGFGSATGGANQPSFWGTESYCGLGWGGLDNETHSDAQGTTGVFETILEAIDNAGFHSFDQMATAYYTLALEEHTPLRRTQKFSRERQLKRFLQDLSFSAEDWPEREAWVYQEVILSLAQRILSRELSGMNERNQQMERRSSGVAGGMSGPSSEEDKLAAGLVPIIESVRSLVEHTDIKNPLVNELRRL
ncbi:uncharacterized protein BCR38DRAFT_404046 [Pseudomassariella vexata]|uniref:Uncharacterized protein n=1 Tax=Pseudomassariella vexata TaxID=1141098 RepID=A0A1Y2EHJ0_9PEZI|nr:uncharacterized protein BCR38DRAFT_404046 [Pseudomassariella vexata]ORY70907.1 hypothetical protein BCR38DRAFT_404046 [Pseudomassariella vexata]